MSKHAQLKLIEIGDKKIIFDGKTLKLRLVPEYTPDKPLMDSDLPANEGFNPLDDPKNASVQYIEQIDKKERLWKLSINVTNTCNLACAYCYADKGVYYTNGLVMDSNIAVKSVNFVMKHFSGVSHVNFFGGEPTLNHETIKLICDYFQYLLEHKSIDRLPSFGLTTNCFVMSQDMLNIIKEYDFSVTVSLDGPEEIHDLLRVRKNQKGTHSNVVKNIRKIMSLDIQPEFECTYTNQHLAMNINIVDLMDYFYHEFGSEVLHIPIVTATPDSPLYISHDISIAQYSRAIQYSFDNYLSGVPKVISTFKRLLSALSSQKPIGDYCPAGKDVITINADGRVYSCSMLMREDGFSFGNIDGISALDESRLIKPILKDGDKWSNANCQACWAQGLCFGCLGEDIVKDKGKINRSTVPGESASCDFKRSIIQVFLEKLGKPLLFEKP